MPTYRKADHLIEAVQVREDNWEELAAHIGAGLISEGKPERLDVGDGLTHVAIPTRVGVEVAHPGDWIIKAGDSKLVVMSPDQFSRTYVEERTGRKEKRP